MRLSLIVVALCCSISSADSFSKEEQQKLIGKPLTIELSTNTVTLDGPLSLHQLLVTGQYPNQDVRDLTHCCHYQSTNPSVATIDASGLIQPVSEGTTKIIVEAASKKQEVQVQVKGFVKPKPVSFRHDLIAVLNVGGCNSGACHGTPSGKNGFRLTLRGYDPDQDHRQLTRDVLGRRTDRLNPEASLIYRKALAKVPHEGGMRFRADSYPAKVMLSWLKQGLQSDPSTLPKLTRLEVLPGERVLRSPARLQQLAVRGHFSNGEVRDVTRLTVFSSSDGSVAEVNANGLVEFSETGEVAILCRYLEEMQTVRLTYLEDKPDFVWPNPTEKNFIDKHVFAKLKMLSIPPSDLCTDTEFVRRAYLDLCGILPTPEEVQTFLADQAKDKRQQLIERLLKRSEYADYWTLKWADVLRVNRKHIQLKGAIVFQQWIRKHLTNNTAFDEVVRELLTANGSTFANPPANYYRIAKDPTSLAETTAQLFFGVRMQCAKCHNHPFERWTQDDYYSLAAFFARTKRKPDPQQPGDAKKKNGAEVVFTARSGEVKQPRSGQVMKPKIMGKPAPTIPPGTTRREILANEVTAKDNTAFAKSVVNRIWYHLVGKGIVDPVDDFRDSNPSANDPLLNALAKEFVEHDFDIQHLIRLIMNSRTYQLSAKTNDLNVDDEKYFSHAITRLFSAETLLDAICQVTSVPEKFAGMPPGTRAVQLPDGGVNHPFLKTFGQPARELACECERESDSNLAQALQLINGPTVNGKLRQANNRIGILLNKKTPPKAILNELYLATLCRLPIEGEVKVSLGHIDRQADKRKAWEDVLWALINSKEFLFRH